MRADRAREDRLALQLTALALRCGVGYVEDRQPRTVVRELGGNAHRLAIVPSRARGREHARGLGRARVVWPRHQHGHIGAMEHCTRGFAEDHRLETRVMPKAADDEQIVPDAELEQADRR